MKRRKIDELENIWKEAAVTDTGIYVEGLMKPTTNVDHYN
jgi:hypothetical protein